MSRITPWKRCDMWFSARSVKTTEYSSRPSGSTFGSSPGMVVLRERSASLHQHAFDAAIVGTRDVVGHPVRAEDAVRHLDDDVVGLEQADLQVAGVAAESLQAARARGEDLQVALLRHAFGRAQRGLVAAQLLFLAETHL